MSLTLLVLAAGMGSRYGGLKQIEPVGPNGETLLDYAVYSAQAAGFTRVVFVIREDFAAAFQGSVGRRYEAVLGVDYVFQDAAALPPGRKIPEGRTKPWGTGHAVWCARYAVAEPFAVINADDFYGAQAFRLLADFLTGSTDSMANRMAMVGFKLGQTLSEHGTVSRGICGVSAAGELNGIVEEPRIASSDVGFGKKYSGKEIVSMNCWGLTPAIFPALDQEWVKFWADLTPATVLTAEFYLPTAIGSAVQDHAVTVAVLASDDSWFGLTYPDDKPRVRTALADLVHAGKFPAQLFQGF